MMRATPLRQAIDDATATLAEAGVRSPRIDAEELAAYVAGTERGRLSMLDAPEAEFFTRFTDLIAARSQRVPLQHLIGTATFGPVRLQVGPGVFIPRPETEAVLEWATMQQLPPEPLIVDLCTGSGALAVAISAYWPQARVIAVDNSTDALRYARRNAAATRVELRHGDVTDAALFPELDSQVDLIVANPPYLPDDVELEPEVAEHDPATALFGGPDGMRVITAIVGLAGRWLRAGGLIAIEHDDTTSSAAVQTLGTVGLFAAVATHTDLARRPRFVTATRKVE
jgi:release factor glutamine methyltransferase